MFEPSKYQQAIFDWAKQPTGNIVIEAVAGSGKTTTIIEMMKYISSCDSAIFVCFNKSIAKELQTRVPAGVQPYTIHSYGNSAIRKNGWAKINGNKVRNFFLYRVVDIDNASDRDKKLAFKMVRFVESVVGLLKAHYWTERVVDVGFVTQLAEHQGIEIPENNSWPDLLQKTWTGTLDQTKVIDFDDMIYLPLYMELDLPKYDWVFVDECQDLNPVQIEMVSRMYRKHAVCVGDTNQAIYGFRGADTEAMATLTKKLNAEVLPLSICYRCPRLVVETAQKVVPQIEAAPSADDGVISDINQEALIKEAKAGDYVLCRTTAPLVQSALRCIREGMRATVLGRDIGKSLLNMISQITDSNSVDVFLSELAAYQASQQEKLTRRNRDVELMALSDKCDTLVALAADAMSVKDITRRIESLFAEDPTDGITFSTVHKSKGLEADRVFILRPDLIPHPTAKKGWMIQQEHNLYYVAVTRAKRELVWVGKKDNA